MKHTISRFFRFFLVAALVAAMAGSLLPTKALGQVTDSVKVSTSPLAAGEMAEWTIEFKTTGPVLPDDGDTDTTEDSVIQLTFVGATIPGLARAALPDMTDEEEELVTALADFAALITVESGDDSGSPMTVTEYTETGFTFNTPVAIGSRGDTTVDPDVLPSGGTATITIAVGAGVTHADTAVVTTVAVDAGEDGPIIGAVTTYNRPTVKEGTLESLNTGQVARWDVTSVNVPRGLVRDQHEITVTFSTGSVPSTIDKNSIRLISGGAAEDVAVDGAVTAGSPALNPSVSGKTIRFVSPVDVAASPTTFLRVIISEAAGIAAQGQPGKMAITIQAGELNPAATSKPVDVGRYISFSPTSAKRGVTVTVSGGGFTADTSGDIAIGAARGDTGGDFTVDGAGKLSGNFTASVNTKDGGRISVQDLGATASAPVMSEKSFKQLASATPKATEVTQGGTVTVTLVDFGDADTKYVVMLAGVDVSRFFDEETSKLKIQQSEGTGTKQVSFEGNDKRATFSITVVNRTLTVSPSSVVPGQAITVSGAGFTDVLKVDLTLGKLSDADDVRTTVGKDIAVNTDGTFLYTGKVPFKGNAAGGSRAWKATDAIDPDGLAAISSGFSVQKRAVTLSPSTANPGSTVEVFGSGWAVTTEGNATSQVTITVTDGQSSFGPFPISSSGEFVGALTVPSNVGTKSLTVTVTDNNGGFGEVSTSVGRTQTGGFVENQEKTATLTVPTGVIKVNPEEASTGTIITVTGSGFPAQTNLSALNFGSSNALPVPAPATDVLGNFTVTLTVPAASRGGSITPGAVVISAKVGQIQGTTSFTIPGPEISLSIGEARPGDEIIITGTGFSAYSNVDTINIGQRNQTPTPNPLTDAVGDFSSSVLVPALNPGAYTVTVRTGTGFTATEPIRILSATSGRTVSPEIAFQALTSRGLLTLAAAAAPGGTEFGAFVPGLAGNTLVQVEPNGVLILTLNADVQIAVSSQPAVSVSADTPTFFALGAAVTVEVIE